MDLRSTYLLKRRLEGWAQCADSRIDRKDDRVSTGSTALDFLLDGGYKRGGITSIYQEDRAGVWPFLALALRKQERSAVISIAPLDLPELKSLDILDRLLVFQTTQVAEWAEGMEAVQKTDLPILLLAYPEDIPGGYEELASLFRSIRLPETAVIVIQKDKIRGYRRELRLSTTDDVGILIKKSPDYRIDIGFLTIESQFLFLEISLYLKDGRLDQRKDDALAKELEGKGDGQR